MLPRGWEAWIAGYFLLLLLLVLRAMAGDATRLSGRFLFVFTSSWTVAALLAALLTRSVSVVPPVLLAVLSAGSWLMRGHALVFGETLEGTAETAADCARRLCLVGERTADGYRFVLPGGALHLRLRRVAAGTTWISQDASPSHRKAELFAQLLAKRYRGAFPVIRIRMG